MPPESKTERSLLEGQLESLNGREELVGEEIQNRREDTRADIALAEGKLSPEEIVISRLERFYRRKRQDILRHVYSAKREFREPTDKAERRKFVRSVGHPESEYYLGRIGRDFFREHMLPTLRTMAKTPEELEQAGRDAIETLELLLIGDRSSTTHQSRLYCLKNFFENAEKPDEWGHSSRGQFKYFYQKWGPQVTKAIAIHQGWEMDRHYGDGDYTNNVRQIERLFEEAVKAVPEQYREKAFRAFVNYGGHYHAYKYLEAIPAVVKCFQENGKEYLFTQFFELACACPDISSQDGSASQDRGFPVRDGQAALAKLEAWEKIQPKFRHRLLGLACALTRQCHGEFSPEFEETDEDELTRAYSRKVSLTGIVRKLETEGYTDRQIFSILNLPKRCAWLGNSAFTILENYAALDVKFPGGVKALLAYCEEIRCAPQCVSGFLSNLKSDFGFQDVSNFSEYLDVGRNLAKKLGNSAQSYFRNPAQADRFYGLLAEPAKFREVAQAASAYTEKFPENDGLHDIRRSVFDLYLAYFGTPYFEDFFAGMDMLLARHKDLQDSNKPNSTTMRAGEMLHRAIGYYEHPPHGEVLDFNVAHGMFVPFPVSFQDHARIAGHFGFEENPYAGGYEEYRRLVEDGLDYRVACRLRPPRGPEEGAFVIVEIPEIECPIPVEKLSRLAAAINRARHVMAAVYKTRTGDLGYQRSMLAQLPQRKAVERMDFSHAENIRREMAQADLLLEDPELKDVAGRFLHEIKDQLKQTLNLAFFRSVMDIGIVQSRGDFQSSPVLDAMNPHTQMALAGMATLMALGAYKKRGITDDLIPIEVGRHLPQLLQQQGADSAAVENFLRSHNIAGVLRRNLEKIEPRLVEKMFEERRRTAGLMPIGAKIHTSAPVSEKALEVILSMFGINAGGFHLIHENKSLVLPPMPTAFELKMLIQVLASLGLLDSDRPQIQTTLGGHLPDPQAGIVGASVLLATDLGVRFQPGSLSTTHDDLTRARLMAYDAGVKKTGLPFDVPDADGRTDILARRSYGDIDNHQLVGSLAVHETFDGDLSREIDQYRRAFHEVLEKHGLLRTLSEARWVHNSHGLEEDNEDPRAHEKMVDGFAQAWMKAREQAGYGVIGDVQTLIREAFARFHQTQPQFLAAHPEETERFLTY